MVEALKANDSPAVEVWALHPDSFRDAGFRDKVAEYIAPALEMAPVASMTTDDILNRLARAELMALGVGLDTDAGALAVLELVSTAGGDLVCHVLTCAGRGLDKWLEVLLEAGRRVAREQGATYLSLRGRPGWQRRLKPHGLEVWSVLMGERL